MDPNTIALAANAVAVLIPYVKKGADKFARDVGEAAAEKVKSLLSTLKARLSGDKEATDTLTHFEEKPDRHKEVLKEILEEKLARDRNLADELSQLLTEMGVTLQINIDVEEAERVMGLRSKRLENGKVSIKVKGKKVKDLTGADIEFIGEKKE